ncbi:hypothetical protein BDW02DRAFT_4416 [Decorospora gaudefroyi]|uniref:Uncharacterized protein n=1 Tax=Decorospora gaudefroyi TaxID=184978 RepID=A0A6A5L078_9PLEO|nr:hypothetical protein BDW02DRAFT_4416 [Decorospora gaudefroyi]
MKQNNAELITIIVGLTLSATSSCFVKRSLRLSADYQHPLPIKTGVMQRDIEIQFSTCLPFACSVFIPIPFDIELLQTSVTHVTFHDGFRFPVAHLPRYLLRTSIAMADNLCIVIIINIGKAQFPPFWGDLILADPHKASSGNVAENIAFVHGCERRIRRVYTAFTLLLTQIRRLLYFRCNASALPLQSL